MTNFEKSEYWLEISNDDLETAKWLLEGKKLIYCCYLCHQVVEKALKSVVSYKTKEMPPKIHDLRKLAKIGELVLKEEDYNLIDVLSPLQIEARYPEYKKQMEKTLNYDRVKNIVLETERFLCWIKELLKK